MRGEDLSSGALFSHIDVEARIPARHPLRAMRQVVNEALADLDVAFAGLYERIGRPSIPPGCIASSTSRLRLVRRPPASARSEPN
jgi:hypothetical protein